ncbi:MAG: enoyl-CoA hydratase/isomerase family protein [Proteobacteria bacterium]|jgi:enoyl-CoA hydratase|nr:enoyl-CoA hydratase/isomerase family protein [Pseudomonadota bacterium]
MSDEVLYEVKDKIARITINRANKMNSINPPLMAELSATFRKADEDPKVSVVILTSAGDHFGAGYDLKFPWSETYGRGPMGTRKMLKDCADFEYGPWDCSKPVIAMVRGYCLAGSCELAMMCCITYAAKSANFGEPEIRFSTAPPAMIMPWLVGLKRSRELLYTGDMIGAEEARQMGMINKVFDDDKLEEETLKYARRAAAISVEGLQTTKASINRGAEIAGLRSAIAYGVEVGGILDASETEQYLEFSKVKAEKGLSAAIRWRESQFE